MQGIFGAGNRPFRLVHFTGPPGIQELGLRLASLQELGLRLASLQELGLRDWALAVPILQSPPTDGSFHWSKRIS
jgi:hypothetical protein